MKETIAVIGRHHRRDHHLRAVASGFYVTVFGAERGLAHIAHIIDMKVDEFAEGLQAEKFATRWVSRHDCLTFSIYCPNSGIVVSQER